MALLDMQSHYSVLTAMLAPAFFLTATASLLATANARLARVIDRARSLLRELTESEDDEHRGMLDRWILLQRRRSVIILRGSQLLYVAITCFVGTSLMVAGDAMLDHTLRSLPTILAACGVLCMFAASVLLARESTMAVRAINEEMDHGHTRANRRSPLI